MSEKKKKLFPKLKKKLQDFLTDESWEITKKDALGIAAGAVLMVGLEDVNAGHGSSYYHDWSPSLPSPREGLQLVENPVCSHVSGVVNWHVSQVPSIQNWSNIYGHNSWHASHSSHGSGWWC